MNVFKDLADADVGRPHEESVAFDEEVTSIGATRPKPFVLTPDRQKTKN